MAEPVQATDQVALAEQEAQEDQMGPSQQMSGTHRGGGYPAIMGSI